MATKSTFNLIPGNVFNIKPSIIGVSITQGTLTVQDTVKLNGNDFGIITGIEENRVRVNIANQGARVCIRIDPHDHINTKRIYFCDTDIFTT